MAKLELISVRIDPDTLAKIDEMVNRHYYWKRNTIINGILTAVVLNFYEADIFDMVRYDPLRSKVSEAKFEIYD